MLGHLGINIADIAIAKRYYGALMPSLDFDVFLDTADTIAFRPGRDKPGTYLFFYQATDTGGSYSRHRTGLQHLAFIVPTRSAVDDVHRLALDLGSEIVHEPQEFPQYPPPYYACFWLDPFGFLLEAVCHHDRD
ncbi:MAG: VOC family protein [Acidimicrobiia bacterium]|nr:VOC family protein [Acidimicrobiia bacterium]